VVSVCLCASVPDLQRSETASPVIQNLTLVILHRHDDCPGGYLVATDRAESVPVENCKLRTDICFARK